MDVASEYRFADNLVQYIAARMSGTHDDDSIISEKPSKYFILGCLAAQRLRDRINEVDEPDNYDSDKKAASIRAQQSRVSLLLTKSSITEESSLSITATGHVYYKVRPDRNEEETTQRYLWKKCPFIHSCHVNVLPLVSQAECHQNSFTEHFNFAETIGVINSDPSKKTSVPLGTWQADISVQINEYDEERLIITITFCNKSVEPESVDDFERTLFNCLIKVKLDSLITSEFQDEYLYEGHHQKYHYDFRTINCQASWISEGESFITHHYGYFEQENVRPKESTKGITFQFNDLICDETAVPILDNFLHELDLTYKTYRDAFPDGVDDHEYKPREGHKERTWGEQLQQISHFKDLLGRVSQGVNLIKCDPKAKEAFYKTNLSFDNYYSNNGTPGAGWRIFQLTFILASLPSVVQEIYLDTVDVLHVDTGGGKSEAYFGLVLFTAFYDRINNKKEGVSAIVKFPLRMLSIQQLERLSSLIIHADAVRAQHSQVFPGEVFSLGYYVGNQSDDFPKTYKEVKKKLYSGKSLLTPAPESLIVSKCPLCAAELNSKVRLIDDPARSRVIHKCDQCNKEFYIYFSDYEIFRWRPTVIVSTVDKWASLAQQRRVRALLGGRGSLCSEGHGFIISGNNCQTNSKDEAFHCEHIGESRPSSDGPRLSIQDEMHLLREGFGTISSHFEGLIESIVKHTSGRQLKHISMSATLNGTSGQIQELYLKNTFVIPGRCPEGVGSSDDVFFERRTGPKRVIYGFKPNLRDNHYATLRTLLHYAEFIINAQSSLNTDPDGFCEEYLLESVNSAQVLIKQFIIPLTYHLKKQDAYDMQRLQDAVVAEPLTQHYGAGVEGVPLTGDDSLEELKQTIDDIKSYVAEYSPDLIENHQFTLKPIYSTSVVSHGVDLEELNFMVFQGIPYSTAEYIQALSRVGRKHLGIVLVWFYPNRVRDDSFFRNFSRYHDTLDHQVRPVPINRSSRLGVYQTLNSMFCASVLTYMSDLKGKPLYQKRDIADLTLEDKERIVQFMYNAYGSNVLDVNLRKEVEERINEVVLGQGSNSDFFPKLLAKTGDQLYRNQSGMRGIQNNLGLVLVEEDRRYLTERRESNE
ncbi:helicase-related protein [Methanoculleus horonobensis]|uniref:helicase-related protein n=1 Tax=Methanoculleus horonobensis TaxID=528314 RepID=UPI0009FCF911|nr:helicase-related protein [Methanoculleus horonobensis]